MNNHGRRVSDVSVGRSGLRIIPQIINGCLAPKKKNKTKAKQNKQKLQCSCWKEDVQRWGSQARLGLEKPGPKFSYFF